MAKITLISAMHWLDVKLDEYDIPSSQQLCLFHVIRRLNRNCWRPVQISVNALALMMNVAKRTAKTALDSLINRGWLVNTQNGIMINFENEKIEEGDESGKAESNGGFESLAERLAKLRNQEGA